MELSSWPELLRWVWTALRRWLPQRILARFWSKEKILDHVHLVHFEQAPRFCVEPGREPTELSFAGFNLFNQTPLKLQIVAADLRISVYHEEWLRYRERFPSVTQVEPFARSGFHIEQSLLSASQVQKLRECADDWLHIDIRGTVFLQSALGELRKDVHSTVVAVVDRGQSIRRPSRIPQIAG
jgi:hypothetical protein